MSDRIDELVAEAAFFNDNGCDKCAIVTELATIARENRTLANQAAWNKVEADKWRKVAEEVAKMAADLSEEFVGAGAGPGEFIDEAVRRILIEQEEAE